MLVHIKPGKPVIAVNTRRSVYRHRFSLAHEIGHFVLRHGNSVSSFENPRSAGGGLPSDPTHVLSERQTTSLLSF
jgi:hypothetical protein